MGRRRTACARRTGCTASRRGGLDLRGALAAAVSASLMAGCAPLPGALEPLPRHPFPRWVEQLEVGGSDAEVVRARFGEPATVEQSVTGGAIHRYRFAEIHWPDDDPDRPVVGARGRLEPRPRTMLEDVGASIAAFGRWLDWLMFYPPRQPRPASPRFLPATIHHLEVRFDLEGRLVAYAYRSEPGRAPVTRPG